MRPLPKVAIIAPIDEGASEMKSMSAKDAKNAFGLLIDTALAEPVSVEKHGRAVVVVISVEEFERLKRKPDSAGRRAKETTPVRRMIR